MQSGRLIKHLRELPPPHVDAEEYLRLVHVADDGADARTATQHAADAVKGAGSAAKGTAAKVTGRIGGMIPRRAKRGSTGGDA